MEQRREQGTIAEEINREEETALPVIDWQVHHRQARTECDRRHSKSRSTVRLLQSGL